MKDILYRISIIIIMLVVISSVFMVVEVRINTATFQSGPSDGNVGGIERGVIIEQHVINPFYSIEEFQLRVGTHVRINDSIITIELLDSEKNIIQLWDYETATLWDSFFLDCKIINPYRDEDFYIRVSSDADTDNTITLFSSSFDSYPQGELIRNGENLVGDIEFIISGQQRAPNLFLLILINLFGTVLMWVFIPKIGVLYEKFVKRQDKAEGI